MSRRSDSSPARRTARSRGSPTTWRATTSRCSGSSCSTWTRRTTPGCARSSPAVSPRAPSAGCEDELDQRAQNIAKAAAAEGTGDFVEQVSCELPLQAIAGLLGVPQEDRDKLFRWSNEMTGSDDPEFADVDPKRPRWS